MTTSRDLPSYLPPRRTNSTADLKAKQNSLHNATPPFLPPRRPASYAEPTTPRPAVSTDDVPLLPMLPSTTYRRPSRGSTVRVDDLQNSTTPTRFFDSRPSTRGHEGTTSISTPSRAPVTRHSSLRYGSRVSKPGPRSTANPINGSFLDDLEYRPRSHPVSRTPSRAGSLYRSVENSPTDLAPLPAIPPQVQEDFWPIPHLQQPSLSRSSSQRSVMLGPKPKPSFSRLSSLDNLITYREEKAEWKRASSVMQSANSEPDEPWYTRAPTITSEPETCQSPDGMDEKPMEVRQPTSGYSTPNTVTPPRSVHEVQEQPQNRFRHIAAEIGFTFTIAMTQFLAEYMISGFAIELPKIIARHESDASGSMGMFWPASLLSLILSATLLVFARISDMYGGYFPFMFGVIWLGIWSLVAGFSGAGVLLDVARAMQGLAIAASTPSTFAMVGSIYPEGPRKNIILGLYAGCAPLGFFAGFLVAGALPEDQPGWYFWIAAALSFITAITAYLTVPHDRTDRKQLGLQMDWAGSFLITAGLILVSYALALEPYANEGDVNRSGWSFPMVLGPLITGLGCLAVAFWVEGWWAKCPLLPFDFFTPRSTKTFALACLCFYASYGVWLYESANFFQSESATGAPGGIQGVTLAAWYTPSAVGGLVLCVLGGALLHIVPIMALLLVSGLAWIAAPLLLALCPLPVSYWAYVMPSMLCATLGIDLTFTVSVVFLSSVQPLRYQGLAGAVSSILVNLAMSFSLSISEIVAESAKSKIHIPSPEGDAKRENWGYQAAFIYAAASAGLGLVICVLFVRISRTVVREKVVDEERPRPSSEASTLVDREG